MAVARTLKFLFLNKLSQLLLLNPSVSKSFEHVLKPEKDLLGTKNSFSYPRRNLWIKDANVYEKLVNQPVSQTKFCTKPKEECKETIKDPPGRHKFHKETEESINKQIGAELNAAFSYLSMACYFGRTDVALPGCQGFFMNMYEEELGHATVFINYQLLRGGYVFLADIETPEDQYWESINDAFSTALEMEKSVKEKLDGVFEVAEKHKDLEVMDIVSTQFMEEQNRSICELARLLQKSKMADNPIGEYLFDKMLYKSFVTKSKDNLMYKKKLDEESEEKVYK